MAHEIIRAERLLGVVDVCQRTGKPYNAVWKFLASGVPTTKVNGERKMSERHLPQVMQHFGLSEPQAADAVSSSAAA